MGTEVTIAAATVQASTSELPFTAPHSLPRVAWRTPACYDVEENESRSEPYPLRGSIDGSLSYCRIRECHEDTMGSRPSRDEEEAKFLIRRRGV